ncbi:LPS-assembly protein LptD [Roseococcus sp. DSY-14]|uniref:LPS-assembly protein LptD n=1 Tax=Roseococcus sp. DSY-14 TaxID=3369650 RepID=UPI00387B4AFD
MSAPPPLLPHRMPRRARRGGASALRRALLGGVALAALSLGTAGEAQQPGSLSELSRLADPQGGLPGPVLRDLPDVPAAPAAPRSEAEPAAADAPVTFTAEEVEYDRESGVVTARGRVEAWQGERFLRAREFIYNRETGVAVLRGEVQLIEADGQVFFAEEVELQDGFKDGVLREVRARLAQNARMAGNGARRTGGTVTDLSRVVYSSCNLCAEDPERPPLWQMRARLATQDRDAQRISYRDATIAIGGVPVLYTPFFSHPDPQTPRASGFLFPTLGYTRFLGAFAQTPYFWAIDEQQDLLVTPTIAEKVLPNIGLEYRRRFNAGELQAQGSVGYFDGNDARRLSAGTRRSEELSGHIFARGRVTLNENWRAGFNLNRASSEQYLRTYRFEVRRFLTSDVYLEGFWGTEAYARFDVRAYQGLRTTDNFEQTPLVTPNAFYEWAPGRKYLGGNLVVDTGLLGLTRTAGPWSQRATTRVSWDRPMVGGFGEVWTVRAQGDARGLLARNQEKLSTPQPGVNGEHVDGNFRLALDWRLPMVRDAGQWGRQTIEPRLQVVTGPSTGRQTDFANEDSLDFEFSDANLFSLNRFTGRDRYEGGTRVDGAFRGAWDLPNGGRLEGLAGRSFRLNESQQFPQNTGLERRWSDYVARVGVTPVSWLSFTGRTRLDSQSGQHRQSDIVARLDLGRVGPLDNVALWGGYLYSPPFAFAGGERTRNEASFGVSGAYRTRQGGTWRLSAQVRYDVQRQETVLITAAGGYEDECFILEGRLLRRFASDPSTGAEYAGNTVFLVRVGLKTVGDYFLRAI